jgi:8-oxo-dGTP pyrophosphatase MutT (NUDIX family)
MRFSKDEIRLALELPAFDAEAAQRQMIPRPRGTRPPGMAGQPRQGAVLVALYNKGHHTHLVLTRRRDDLNDHAGQIAFPGGRREGGEALQTTALREAEEEIGLRPAEMTILGQLSLLYIPPTGYEVYPFVAWHDGRPRFRPQVSEVAQILEVSLSHLLDPASQFEETWDYRGMQIQVPFYLVGSHKVWGATAMMLSEFLERLRGARGLASQQAK